MNVVEKLIAIDKGDFDRIEKLTFYSKSLSDLLKEKTEVTIQAVNGDQISALTAGAVDRKGNFKYEKMYSTNLNIVVAGMVEPNLKDEGLIAHLGVITPAEAAQKIFKGEINYIADEILKLSGFKTTSEMEEEIKN